MTESYWLPKELRQEYLWRLKGVPLIEQCHPAVSSVCDEEEFWREKLYYDYKIKQNDSIYTSPYTPYELYVLITYFDKYFPGLADSYIRTSETQSVYMQLFNNAFYLENIFRKPLENQDVIDIYIKDPRVIARLLRGAHRDRYRDIYKYLWDNYPSYHDILLILDAARGRLYWGAADINITLSLLDLSKIIKDIHRIDDNAIMEIYNEQFLEE